MPLHEPDMNTGSEIQCILISHGGKDGCNNITFIWP